MDTKFPKCGCGSAECGKKFADAEALVKHCFSNDVSPEIMLLALAYAAHHDDLDPKRMGNSLTETMIGICMKTCGAVAMTVVVVPDLAPAPNRTSAKETN